MSQKRMRASGKISTGTRAYIEEQLEDYPKYDRYVKDRMSLLLNRPSPDDDNIGGGRAQNHYVNPIDEIMITVEGDKRLNLLAAYHFRIQACFEDSPEEVQTMVKELYFKEPRLRKYSTINDLCNAGKIHISKTVAYDMFNCFLIKCAKALYLYY